MLSRLRLCLLDAVVGLDFVVLNSDGAWRASVDPRFGGPMALKQAEEEFQTAKVVCSCAT